MGTGWIQVCVGDLVSICGTSIVHKRFSWLWLLARKRSEKEKKNAHHNQTPAPISGQLTAVWLWLVRLIRVWLFIDSHFQSESCTTFACSSGQSSVIRHPFWISTPFLLLSLSHRKKRSCITGFIWAVFRQQVGGISWTGHKSLGDFP